MLEINFQPYLEIQTERLLIRQVNEEDAQALFMLRTDDKVMQYINRPRPKEVSDARILIQRINKMIADNVGINWGITLKTAPQSLIGMISFHRIEKEHYRAEIGYLLHPDYWGQGIVSEGVGALVKFGFEQMGLNSIEGHIRPQNAASRQVLLKNNFVKEATFRENIFFEGQFLDTEVYTLLKSDYK